VAFHGLVIQNKGQTPTYARGSSEGVSGAGMFTPKPVARQWCRKANRTMWNRNIIKQQRLSGQVYTNRGGKEIAEKKPRVF
jgi:hypothetical protein